VRYREYIDGSLFEDNMFGFLTGPDEHVVKPAASVESLSATVGGFVQDSWSVLDKVTVNIGARYDAQYLISDDGTLVLALPNQWSPRLGAVYDFTQQGRSKIFGSFARYYESVPLDIVDRAFSNEGQLASLHYPGSCDPTDPAAATGTGPGQCQNDATRIPLGSSAELNREWVALGGGKVPVDPDLSPQSSDEVILGVEYEVIPNGRLGAQYTKRWLNHVIEDIGRDGGAYFIGNPGEGIATDLPRAARDYDAGTFYFQKAFADLWLAQVSYTVSYLRGNYAGLYHPESGLLSPNFNTDFDHPTLTVNRDGTLPGDRTHELKAYGAKAFVLPGGMAVDLGLTYQTRSGSPTSHIGAHQLFGPNQVYILPRGSGERTPWVHNIDAHVGYSITLSKASELTLGVDVFNVFNFQAAVAVDESYTFADVLPCSGEATVESCVKSTDGSPFAPNNKNPNFGKPTRYQAPRAIRFGARATF
jgi:outer membrane receptor protein involved in Fe transport